MLKDQLISYRKRNYLSLQDMADMLGVTFTTYWRWENGYSCNLKNARTIKEKLKINAYDK